MPEDNKYLDLGYGQGLEGWGITPGDIYQQRQYALDEGNRGLLSFIGGLGAGAPKKALNDFEDENAQAILDYEASFNDDAYIEEDSEYGPFGKWDPFTSRLGWGSAEHPSLDGTAEVITGAKQFKTDNTDRYRTFD
jgi:hypothetical protein